MSFPSYVTVLEQHSVILLLDDGRQLNCVISKDFNFDAPDSVYISFSRILRVAEIEYPSTAFIGRQFDFIIDVLRQYASLNFEQYLVSMILLDVLTGNEDRHLNNFGILKRDSSFHFAPLFDFGLGLFEHDRRYDRYKDCTDGALVDAIAHMECKPFNTNLISNLKWLLRNYNDFVYGVLPRKFVVSHTDFPSKLAEQYFQEVCRQLGVGIRLEDD